MADNDGIGFGEVAAGTVVGAGVAAGTTHFVGKKIFSEAGQKEFSALAKATVGTPVLTPLGSAEVTQGMRDNANKILKAAPEYEKAGTLGRMKVAFKGMSTGNKVALGAAVGVAALGTMYVANKMFRGNSESHVERLQRQRAAAMSGREL